MATIDPRIVRHLKDAQPDLYWLDADPLEPSAHSALVGEIEVDLAIVGAGYTGLWTALLAKEKHPDWRVVIIEMRETGAGASGRNGGFCNYSLTHGWTNGKRRFPDEMGIISRLGRENLEAIEETIKKFNIQCNWEWTGELRVAIEPWQLEGMREEAEERNRIGDVVEFLDKDAIQAFPTLQKNLKKYVVPVYDYQIVTEPLTAEQMESIGWGEREGISDSGHQFHYYRLTDDNCIVWGGWDAIYNFRGRVAREYEFRPETYVKLVDHFLKTFPQLEGIKFTHAWGGAIDTCTRFSPFWNLSKDKRVVSVLGYTGLGVAATRFGAQVMLDLLDGEDNERTRLSMVRKRPLPFPPEPFRFFFIQITRWSINRADENGGKRNLWLRMLDRLGLGFDS
ncbi:MAG: FAD-dependent oxidoreductase [Actinobacteria bacterium]|nr:FAD-dependent oxidoreductase [Actinomycetota bacterium]